MKERLTIRTKGLKDEECVDLLTPQGWYTSSIFGELTKKALERLADYEDIGTVEELMALKEQNEALKKQLENAVVLPCKVGDTVYMVYTKEQRYPFKIEVANITYKNIGGKKQFRIEDNISFGGTISDELTTIFVTKTEALARLAELKEAEKC